MDTHFMMLAINMAKKGLGQTWRNPLVGSIIVKNGTVIAEGAHLFYGGPHAERHAIESCQTPEELFDSTLYVTLEPCHHTGKQPPCTEAIVACGIKKVIIGQLDPNPLVAGKGREYLETQGIEVVVGILEQEVKALNPHYNQLHEAGLPFVTLKNAISLDGKVSINETVRTLLTGQEVWSQVRKERAEYQAILVGSGTVLTDNPILGILDATKRPPVKVIIDRRGRLLKQKQLKIFQENGSQVRLYTESREASHLTKHVKVIHGRKWTIPQILADLGKLGIQSVYVEGGPTIHDAFLEDGNWSDLITYVSPKLIGGNSLAAFSSQRPTQKMTELLVTEVSQLGTDLRIVGRRLP